MIWIVLITTPSTWSSSNMSIQINARANVSNQVYDLLFFSIKMKYQISKEVNVVFCTPSEVTDMFLLLSQLGKQEKYDERI